MTTTPPTRDGPARGGRTVVEDVTAVLLHPGGSPGDADTTGGLLAALAAQRRPPTRVLLVGLDPDGEQAELFRTGAERTLGVRAQVLPDPGSRRQQVESVRATLPQDPGHWIWFLTPDSTPEPGALGALVAATRRSSRVGIVGPKLVHADEPRLLRAMGHHLTPAGRGADPAEAALVDQGQLDLRQDVLGVPLAGSLVSSSVLEQVGGLDAAFDEDGVDGLDLGWRSHLAGHRVVVAPDAVVQQGADGLGVRDPLRTRVRLRQVALARGPLRAAPGRALGVLLSSLAAAVLLLLVKRPREAAGEWADVRGVLSPARGWGARRRFRGRRVVDPRDLMGLHDPPATGWRSTMETVGDALDPRRRRGSTPGRDARRSTESGPVSEDFAELAPGGRARPRRWSWPLAFALLLAAGATAWVGRDLLSALRPGAPGLVGPELGVAATDGPALWSSATQAWRGAGLGHAGMPELWLLPAAALASLVGLAPGAGAGAGPALAWLLALGPVLSVLTAYLALRRSTHRRWLRAGMALGWAAAAPLTVGLAQGRVGPVLVHVAAPLLLAGLVVLSSRRGGVRRTAATFATVLGVALTALWVPSVLLLSSAAGLGLLVLGRGRARWRAAVLAVLPWALLLPFLPGLVADPVRILGGAGATSATALLPAAAQPWQLLLLHPGGGLDPSGWEALPLWSAVPLWLAALAALLLPGTRGRRAAVLVAAALVSLAVAQVATRTSLGVLPDGHLEQGLAVVAWPGTALSLAGAGLLLAAASALDQVLPEGRRWRAPRPLLGLAAGAVVVLPGLVVASWAVSSSTGTSGLQPAREPLPAVAAEQASGPGALRTLVLEPGSGEREQQLVVDLRAEEPEPARILRDRAAELATGIPPRDAVETTAQTLTGGAAGAEVSEQLVDLGVGYVLLEADEDHPVAVDLDRVDGLTRVSSPPGSVLWRMAENDPARVRVLDEDGDPSARVDVLGPHASARGTVADVPDGATLAVAEGAGWAEHATVRVDGEQVEVSDPAAIPLPEGGPTEIEISVASTWWPWHVVALLLAAVTAFLALPVGRTDPEPEGGR
ncbi:glycosyltransferase [Serinicoccus sp. LYQ131]|uniref:glycosyltransferase n=1 Tax=Serinicoccus sp. LYQ131 TaxID=3378797 RepID=UPI0038531E6F